MSKPKTAAPPQPSEQTAPPPIKSRKPRQAKMGGPQMMLIRKAGSTDVIGVVNGPSADAGIKAVIGEYVAQVVGIGEGFKIAAANGLTLIDLYADPQPQSAGTQPA